MVRVINMSYKISKSSFVWQKKMEENKKNMKEQLNGVSKAISNLAQNIEKDVTNEEEYGKEKGTFRNTESVETAEYSESDFFIHVSYHPFGCGRFDEYCIQNLY